MSTFWILAFSQFAYGILWVANYRLPIASIRLNAIKTELWWALQKLYIVAKPLGKHAVILGEENLHNIETW